jgi:hypothetical protein
MGSRIRGLLNRPLNKDMPFPAPARHVAPGWTHSCCPRGGEAKRGKLETRLTAIVRNSEKALSLFE